MNCLEFYEAVTKREYLKNPERAEQLYDYSKDGISEALQGKDVADLSVDEFATTLTTYWKKMGIDTMEMLNNMIQYLSNPWREIHLRPEFDEEYAEYFHAESINHF